MAKKAVKGLKSLASLSPAAPDPPHATVEFEGVEQETGEEVTASYRFRAPNPGDLSDPQGNGARIRAQFPGLDDASVHSASLLGACYLPDEGDEGLDAAVYFANMGAQDAWGFKDLGDTFFNAFPQFRDWCGKQAKKTAKNA